MTLYDEDLLIAYREEEKVENMKTELRRNVRMKELCYVRIVLGIEISGYREISILTVCHPRYGRRIVE